MPQPKKAARFGGSPAHHNLILANLATELFRHGQIRTTHAKAKNVQPLAERMVTFAKRGDVHSRRQVLRVIRDRDVVHKLFADIGPVFADRNGGYTRVLKLGPRKGDAAPMALIELVEGIGADGDRSGELAEAPRRRWSLRRRRGTMSTGAREREEQIAAAADRGEEREEFPEVEPAPEREPAEAREEAGVQADPAEVEARLAAEEEASDIEAEPGGESADGEDEPSGERPGRE